MPYPVSLSELPSDEVKMNSFKKPQSIYTVVKLPDLAVPHNTICTEEWLNLSRNRGTSKTETSADI